MNAKLLKSKPFIVTMAATGLATVLGGYVWHMESRPPILEIHLFSLASGQAALIRTPDDRRILVDGGGNAEIVKRLGSVLPFYSRRIDAIVATVLDKRHLSGLIDVVERYKVGRAYVPSVTLASLGLSSTTEQAHKVFLKTLHENSVPIQEVGKGDEVEMGNEVHGEILFPADPHLFEYSKTSSPSIIMSIRYRDLQVLVLGSITKKIQKYVANEIVNVKGKTDDVIDEKGIKILVVSNSASDANTAGEIVESFDPDYLVYSKSVSTATAIGNSKRDTVDLFSSIPGTKRFNLKQEKKLTIVSDGGQIEFLVL